MDTSYISAIAGLAGALIGGLTSFSTTWLTQKSQIRERHREAARVIRQELFSAFITEASRLLADALSHEKDDVADLVQLYALIAKMRLMASRPVVAAAEAVLNAIITAYLGPNRTLHELRQMAEKGEMNFLVDFGEACRAELNL